MAEKAKLRLEAKMAKSTAKITRAFVNVKRKGLEKTAIFDNARY
jgi:hypothetical protein